jgi:hypothetical protein
MFGTIPMELIQLKMVDFPMILGCFLSVYNGDTMGCKHQKGWCKPLQWDFE